MVKIKVPPHNEEAEQSVLGAILIDKDAILNISEIISPSDFYNPTHGIIFDAMFALYEERKPIDIVTLSNMLKKKKDDKIDTSYLTDLVNAVPTSANVKDYALIIRETSIKRALIKTGTSIAEMAFAPEEDVKDILNKAEQEVFSISQGNVVRGFVQIKHALAASFDKIDELSKKNTGLRGIKTGFGDLDHTLSGLQDSNLIILAARPGQGKTAMAINIAQHVAVVDKAPVGIFSLEMSQEELVDRLLVGQADVDAWRLKTGKLPDSDLMKISDAMGKLAEAPIFIDDTPGISVSEMRTKARRLQMEHGIKLLIVDYLQLINPGGKRYENRVQEVSMVSQSLKNLARELKIPIVALSQLSRAVEHRGEKKPQLADLRESGSIEQDADVVMFLYKVDDEYSVAMPTKLLIAKHRNGPTAEIDLLFRGDRIRFYSIEKQHAAEQMSASA